MTAPTEAEIREALRRRVADWPSDDPRKPLRDAIEGWASTLTSPAFDALESIDPRDDTSAPDGGDVWVDLRASEAIVLRELASRAIEHAVVACEALIVDELTAAGVQFATEHPDAPRATREAVPA